MLFARLGLISRSRYWPEMPARFGMITRSAMMHPQPLIHPVPGPKARTPHVKFVPQSASALFM